MFGFRVCLLPLCVMFAIGSLSAVAQDAPAKDEAKPKRTAGTVAAVGEASLTVTPKAKKAKEGEEASEPEPVSFAVNDQTKVRVDGKSASLADVQVGYAVTVVAMEGEPALRVIAMSPDAQAKREEQRKAKAEQRAKEKEQKEAGDADEGGM